MSRWSNGTWVMAAVVLEDDGTIYPLSKLSSAHPLKALGYYERPTLFTPIYYRMNDMDGCVECMYEGSFTIKAFVRITDKNGNTNILRGECDGYTCCGEDCYMLMIITPGKDAASTTAEFQVVDEVEFLEAVGRNNYNNWSTPYTEQLDKIDKPLF